MVDLSKNSRIGQLVGVASLVLVLLATPRAASPVADVQFQVNTFTANTQRNPGIAMDPAGNFVVAWTSFGQDGDDAGVFAQCFDANATRRGAEFQVNTFTAGQQFDPVVGMDGSGNFVVAWTGDFQDGSGFGVFGRRFDGACAAQGPEFQVNSTTVGSQFHPAVAMNAAGTFVVAWTSESQDGDGLGVFAQRFDATGSRQGAEFQVNTSTLFDQFEPAVALDAAGNFVVAWTSTHLMVGAAVFAQRFGATGTPRGTEFQVNAEGDAQRPSVGSDAAG